MYIGQISICAFDYAPQGYLLCDGAELSIEKYRELFNVIGTIYGGDGVHTFRVPDLRGRVPMHISKEPGRSVALGEHKGEEAVALTPGQIPSNRHLSFGQSAGEGQAGSYRIQETGAGQPHDNMQPYTVLNFIIALYDYPYDYPLIGEVRMTAASRVAKDWAPCNGMALQPARYTPLLALIDTKYGGNGYSIFHVPDLVGRVPVGQGSGPGLSERPIGQQGGQEQVALTAAQLPADTAMLAPASASAAPATGKTTGFAAAGQPHANMGPYLAINFNIALNGVFPSRGN